MSEKITYSFLKENNFIKDETLSNDNIWESIYGYSCFSMKKILHKGLELSWYPDGLKMELIRYKKQNVIDRREINYDELVVILNVFDRNGDIEKEYNYTHFA